MIGLLEYCPELEKSLASTIGNEYGDIYEKQLEVAKASKLNENEIPPFYNTLMKPTMGMRAPKMWTKQEISEQTMLKSGKSYTL